MSETCKHQFGRRRDKEGNLLGKGQRKCALCGVTETLAPTTALVEIRRAANEGKYGPAMRALTDMQQRFVVYLMDTSGGQGDYTQAAIAAGYSPEGSYQAQRVTASRLAHDEKVMAAIQEEGQRRINGMTGRAVIAIEDALRGGDHKTKLKAADMVLNRSGLHAKTEHKVVVEHVDDADKIARVTALAKQMGMDPAKLLGTAGVVIEAEFEEVT